MVQLKSRLRAGPSPMLVADSAAFVPDTLGALWTPGFEQSQKSGQVRPAQALSPFHRQYTHTQGFSHAHTVDPILNRGLHQSITRESLFLVGLVIRSRPTSHSEIALRTSAGPAW